MTSWTITRFIRPDYSTVPTVQLIGDCAGGHAAAWREFIRRFHSIIAICADHGRVLRQFRLESGDAISGFLKIVTANIANDHFTALCGDKRGGNVASAPGDGPVADSDTVRPALSGRRHPGRNK